MDLDAFYASVETLKDPSLAGKPVVVGASGARGVVMSASYEARTRGLHCAMPSVRARRLCPDAVFVAARLRRLPRLLQPLPGDPPVVHPDRRTALAGRGVPGRVGRDEAVRAAARDRGPHPRRRCRASCRCPARVGVGPTKFVAKLASTRAKPDGVIVVPAGEVLAFLHPLPVGALWGVGERTAETLDRLGIRMVGELARTPDADPGAGARRGPGGGAPGPGERRRPPGGRPVRGAEVREPRGDLRARPRRSRRDPARAPASCPTAWPSGSGPTGTGRER